MNRDWTGNKKSIFTTLGASSHSEHEREEHDYYATDPATIKPLLDMMTQYRIIGDVERSIIWENASGGGHLSDELERRGFNVVRTDIVQREPKCKVLDFLNDPYSRQDIFGEFTQPITILTNPPYRYAQEWVEKSMDILEDGEYLVMFLKLTFLEGQKRLKMFKEYPPKYVWVFSRRQKCAMNGDFENTGSSASCYAWFVWEKGSKVSPTIDWII